MGKKYFSLNYFFILLIGAVLLTNCGVTRVYTTTPNKPSQLVNIIQNKNYATINIYRPPSVNLAKFSIFINGNLIAKLSYKSKLTYKIFKSGKYEVMTGHGRPWPNTLKSINVSLGEKYYLKLSASSLFTQKILKLVEEKIGQSEFNKISKNKLTIIEGEKNEQTKINKTYAQTIDFKIEWEKTFGGKNNDKANSIIQTTDGGYAVAGQRDWDFWIIKLDENGNKKWDKTFGGSYKDEANSIIQTTDGGYAVAGQRDWDFGIIKLDENGNKVWDKTFGGSYNDEANSIIQTTDGGYAVAGQRANDDFWIIKLDENGNKKWDKTFGDRYDYKANSIIQTTDGGYAVAGQRANDDFWIIKLDENGNKKWDKTFGGRYDYEANSTIQTTDGGYAVAGQRAWDFWIIKLDENGNKKWDKTFGGSYKDEANSIIQTTDGGYAIAGYTKSEGKVEKDFWIIKLDENGNKKWDKTFGGSYNDEANSIIQTTDGGYAVAGYTNSKGAGNSDFCVIKFLNNNINERIKLYVEEEINKWQQKGLFEKTNDYKKRVTSENRQKLIEEFTQNKVNEIANKIIKLNIVNNEYDADNEVYKLEFNNFIPIYVKVPIKGGEAKSFYDKLNNLQFNNAKYTITKQDEFALLYLNVYNPANNKEYTYDAKEKIQYKNQKLVFNFGPVKVDITSKPIAQLDENGEVIIVGESDVDINIPETNIKKPNTYALIIGNEDYKKYQTTLTNEQNVKFAINDAKIFAQYCYLTLGIPKENIKIETNVISSRMKRDIEWLISRAKYGGTNIKLIFYYSGHGFPDSETKEKYLIPVDISGAHITEGIKLNKLYNDLTKNQCKRVTMFIDACFSGAGRETGLLAARGIKIHSKKITLFEGNLIAFSSSQGKQRSYFYRGKQHGIFTYYLLKELQETKGNITYGRLKNYLKKEVPLKSVDLYEDEQVPDVNYSFDIKDEWQNWKFNEIP